MNEKHIFEECGLLPARMKVALRRKFPAIADGIESVFLCGMGSAEQAAHLTVWSGTGRFKIPAVVCSRGVLPEIAGSRSLVLLISYSGDTPEMMETYQQATARGCAVTAITSGGRLGRLCRKNGHTVIRITEKERIGGSALYLFSLLTGLLIETGVMEDCRKELLGALRSMTRMKRELSPDIDLADNQAKRIAEQIFRGFPLLCGSGPPGELAAAVWKSLLHTITRTPAFYIAFPDAAYAELAGFQEPRDLLRRFVLIWLRGHGETENGGMTEDAVALMRNRVRTVIEIDAAGDSPIDRMISLIYLGEYTCRYLAVYYGTDLVETDLSSELMEQRLTARP